MLEEKKARTEGTGKNDKQKRQGKETAKSLLAELTVLEAKHHLPSDSQLRENVPTRDNVHFSITKQGAVKVLLSATPDKPRVEQGRAAPQPATAVDLDQQATAIAPEDERIEFCYASGFVGPTGFFDVDHVFPFDRIREKQEALLEYLNDEENLAFTKAFMGIEPEDSDHRREIEKYFGCCVVERSKDGKTILSQRDIKNLGKTEDKGKVVLRGKGLFFRGCYNELGNLILLSHPENMRKSAKLPGEKETESGKSWIEEHPLLGEKCMHAMKEKGGIHDGIIVQKVFDSTGCEVLVLGLDQKGEEIRVFLHEGRQTQGLGEFIRSWSKQSHPKYMETLMGAYQEVWTEMKNLVELTVEDSPQSQNRHRIDKLICVISASIRSVHKYFSMLMSKGLTPISDTDSDDSREERGRESIAEKQVIEGLEYMHRAKKLYRAIAENSSLSEKELNELQDYFWDELDVYHWQSEGQEDFFRFCNENLLKLPQGFSFQEAKKLLMDANQHSNPILRAEAAEKRAKTAEEQMCQEKAAKEAAEEQICQEKAAKEAAEKEIRELKEKLATLTVKEEQSDDSHSLKM